MLATLLLNFIRTTLYITRERERERLLEPVGITVTITLQAHSGYVTGPAGCDSVQWQTRLVTLSTNKHVTVDNG